MSAMKPFHPRTFWKHANTLYRHFTVFFLAHALQVTYSDSYSYSRAELGLVTETTTVLRDMLLLADMHDLSHCMFCLQQRQCHKPM